ncbi:MFS transporter [Gordonia sp. NPDC003424]
MNDVTVDAPQARGISRGMTLLFAFAGGAAVGNLYWAQPLLDSIAESFGTTVGVASLVVTATQVGYACGIFFLVPLGDVVNRKRVIPVLLLSTAAALVATGVSPTFPALIAAVSVLGVTTVAGQFLTPLAGDLASDEQRGRVLTSVASGLMLGLLLARAISGIVADLFGWRVIYFGAAALAVVLAAALWRLLPETAPRARVRYGTLLVSTLRTVADHAQVRVMMLLGALTMCVFTMFWTGLTFLLSAAPYSYSTGTIGLVSLVGVGGAVAAQQSGRLYDRGLSLVGIGAGFLTALIALVLFAFGKGSIVAVLVVIALFSVGSQVVQVLIQARMLSVDPQARSRLNTVFIVANFIGGAIGGALAGGFWQWGGSAVLIVAEVGVVLVAILVWFTQWRQRRSV